VKESKIRKIVLSAIVTGALIVSGTAFAGEAAENARLGNASRWMVGDFHQHTTYTDGSYAFDYMMAKNKQFGVDWWANSEHGGTRARDGRGNFWDVYTVNPILDYTGKTETFNGTAHQAMWRWQSLRTYAYWDVLAARGMYPDNQIFAGVEWNVPNHEHCSVSIVPLPGDNTASAVAAFEYQFDASDTDTLQDGKYFGAFGPLVKNNSNTHQAAVDAVTWMEQQYRNRTIDDAWIIFAHIERHGAWKSAGGGGYNVESFRDFNNAAPDICFGFEGVPGHQAGTARGEFTSSASGGGTYGGAGFYTARTGGLWDALLGEGRRWFNFANSDSHLHWDEGGSDYYPGEYQKNRTYVADRNHDGAISRKEIAQALRSGNSFLTAGDLIDALDFSVKSEGESAAMGGELKAYRGREMVIRIKFKSPEKNNNGDTPVVDHIDLIAGDITGKIDPADANYTNAANASTRVIRTFTASDWTEDGNGYRVIKYRMKLKRISSSTDLAHWKGVYFRLRGTNNALTSAEIDQTSSNHDPALDPQTATTADQNANAWKDLWFYGNPIFVRAIGR